MSKSTLIAMYVASFAAMFFSSYTLVSEFGHVLPSINKAYMAGIMTAFMSIINTILMGKMYPSQTVKNSVLVGSVLLAGGIFAAMRWQVGVDDKRMMQAMISHHSQAILICEQANLTDPPVQELCREIIEAQVREIQEMKDLLSQERYQ